MTDETQYITDVNGWSEWDSTPELYLQTTGIYTDRINKGRLALEAADADTITFFWVGKPESDGFLEPIDDGSDEHINEPIAATWAYHEGEPPTELYIKDAYSYESRWQGPHLLISAYDAILYWPAKHSNEELRVTINEGTK